MARIEQAVILAAGEGQRLRPFTASKPKVMIPIANKPILRYVIEAVERNGIRNVIVVVGYKKEQVIDYFGNGEEFGVEIEYVDQKQQLGTAHALKQAEAKLKGRFLMLSGDNIIEPGTVAELVRTDSCGILVRQQNNVTKYGVVEVDDGRVTDIVEKPTEALSHLVNTGIYVFDDGIFEAIGRDTDIPTVIRTLIGGGKELGACEATGTWLDVVYPWDMLKLNDLALADTSPSTGGLLESGVSVKGTVSIGKGTLVRSGTYIVGPAIVGENCEIGPNACILPSTSIGDNVNLSPFALVANSIVSDGVEIGAGCHIRDSVIDRGCRTGGHFVTQSGETGIEIEGEHRQAYVGAMIGEDCRIGDGVVALPGVLIGNRCSIRPLKVISGNLPDESVVM